MSALVHIAQSPYHVADAYAGASGARATRAKEVLDLLGDDEKTRAEWEERTKTSCDVRTTLGKLGVTSTADLLLHAYTLAACNLHVLLDYPLPDPLLGRDYFLALTGTDD